MVVSTVTPFPNLSSLRAEGEAIQGGAAPFWIAAGLSALAMTNW
jgi:hypothetical protein